MKLILVALLGLSTIYVKASTTWSYTGDNGVENWSEDFPICGESRQSPIALNTNASVLNESLLPFPRSLFDSRASAMVIRNTEHSLQVDLDDGYIIDNAYLLPGAFKAAQFHIHWGAPGEKGSEHTLNGVQYFGELHIVHYNTKYSNLSTAASQSDGLAVLGFFLQDNYPQDNLAFNRFLNPVANGSIRYGLDSLNYQQSDQFSVETLLPNDLSRYLQYSGSLTTPPCFESVVWTVFEDPLRISQNQAQVLRTSLFVNSEEESESLQLFGNFRPVQPLNGRTVMRATCAGGGSSSIRFSVLYLLFAVLLLLINTSY